MSEWVGEWVSERVNKWVNGWVSDIIPWYVKTLLHRLHNVVTTFTHHSTNTLAYELVGMVLHKRMYNALFPWGCGFEFKCVTEYVVVITIMCISNAIATRWMARTPADDRNDLVQVMARCHQVTSHYLKQCRLWSLAPYDVTMPNDTFFICKPLPAECLAC